MRMLWSDIEVREALVKVYQDILEGQGQAIEDAKSRLSNKESPIGNLMSAAADLNFHTKWRKAAINLIETLYFQLFGEEFGTVNIGSANRCTTAEGILKEIIDEYDALDIHILDTKIDKARAFLDKQTESNDEEE